MNDFIDSNGVRTAVRLDGPQDAPVVMFGNSLMCDYEMWRPQVEALARRYRILRYDMRAQGNSEVTPGPYSMDQYADDAYQVMRACDVSRVHFVGISFGGMIGQRLAVRYPEAVASLSLCDTGSRFPFRDVWNQRISIASSEGMAGLVDMMLQRWFREDFIKSATAAVDRVRAMILATPVDGFCACCEMLRDTDMTDSLGDIEAPSLVLHGACDPIAELSRILCAGIPNSRYAVVDDAGHLPNIEKAAAFNAIISEHLDRHA